MTSNFHSQCALRRAVFLLCATLASARAAAQSTSNVTIALTHRLSDSSARAMIVREAGANARTLIVMRDDADAATLATALKGLERSRRKVGDLLQYEVVITLREQRRLSSLTPDEQRVAEEYLSRLRNAPTATVTGVGLAKAVTMQLPLLPSANGS